MAVMSTIRSAGIFFLFALGASAVQMEKMGSVPLGWSRASATDGSTQVSLQVALALSNLDQLESKLFDVSTPGSSNYGKYLDKDDVTSLFAPSQSASSAVTDWLSSNGISNAQSDGQFISFTTTVDTANKLLDTQFSNFVDAAGNTKIRTTAYSVPDDVAQYIDLVEPTVYLGTTTASVAIPKPIPDSYKLTKRQSGFPPAGANCSAAITPSCLKQIYNVGNYTPIVSSGSRIGFGSFLNESANYVDLALFEQLFDIPPQNFSVELINGGFNNQTQDISINGEADLDVQYIIGMSHPLPVTEFITGGSPPIIPNVDEPAGTNENEPYLPYYQYLLSRTNAELPQVISNSYGDDEQTVPYKYANRVCNMIGMLGLRGISVLESAGDLGVGAACLTNDGTNTTRFTPQFPATCPYVTAVGGTQSIFPEVAWVAGSGGFSDYFSQPYYQVPAVQNYLNTQVSAETKAYYAPFFNSSGRGFPDVSAHSLTPDFEVIYESQIAPSGGTSAASPTFAGIVALLNDARLRAGEPALGFLNPWLYTTGLAGLTDITGGQSDGCTGVNLQTGAPVVGGGIIPGAHWNATVGWDPVTGLGVPNFQALKLAALI